MNFLQSVDSVAMVEMRDINVNEIHVLCCRNVLCDELLW
jgi:hypothetical protein